MRPFSWDLPINKASLKQSNARPGQQFSKRFIFVINSFFFSSFKHHLQAMLRTIAFLNIKPHWHFDKILSKNRQYLLNNISNNSENTGTKILGEEILRKRAFSVDFSVCLGKFSWPGYLMEKSVFYSCPLKQGGLNKFLYRTSLTEVIIH